MVKVQRSYPAPESLEIEAQKPNGSYSCDDVVERLKDGFHNKLRQSTKRIRRQF